MEFESLANLGWREALIAIVAVLVLYVLVVFWRMSRLKRLTLPASTPESFVAQSAVAAYEAVQEPALPEPPETPVTLSEIPFPWNEPPPEIPGQRMIERLEREVTQLRKEVAGLRAEVLVLREERQQEQVKPNVAQAISPFYSEAMQMAVQGADALTISQNCGISRAEAELVLALVRNQDSQ